MEKRIKKLLLDQKNTGYRAVDEDGGEYRIIKALDDGEGGQGIVYEVSDSQNKEWCLKWVEDLSQEEISSLRNVRKIGIDHRQYFEDFVAKEGIYYTWPLHMVTRILDPSGNPVQIGSGEIGYIMTKWPLEDCINYQDLQLDGENWDYDELCRVSEQLCRAISGFNQKGLAYKDVSRGNIRFDLANKKLYVIDPDNISVSDASVRWGIKGTPEFIAPEVIREEKFPNTHSDEFSVAVMLFFIWVKDHPFEGGAVDLGVDRYLASGNPVFIFDPTDQSNCVDENVDPDGDFARVRYWWPLIPERLRELFTETFTKGIRNDSQRVTNSSWVLAFRDIRESQLEECTGCHRKIAKSSDRCGFCGKVKPPRSFNTTEILVMSVYEDGKDVSKYFRTDVIRELSGEQISDRLKRYPKLIRYDKHPNDETRMVLRNVTDYVTLELTLKDGSVGGLAPDKAVAVEKIEKIRIDSGVTLHFEKVKLKVASKS